MNITTNIRFYLIFLAFLIILGCIKNSEITPTSDIIKENADRGKLTGRVVRCALYPRSAEDLPNLEPAPNINIVILTQKGEQICSVKTDERGIYNVSLPPNTYIVKITDLPEMEFTRSLPDTVTITKDQETQLDVYIDTGIR